MYINYRHVLLPNKLYFDIIAKPNKILDVNVILNVDIFEKEKVRG